MPGRFLLAVSWLMFDDDIHTTVVCQTIADLRDEWFAAATLRERLLARWRGYVAFWTLLAMAPFSFASLQRRSLVKPAVSFRLIAVFLALGLTGGYLLARSRPAMYRSSAIIQLVPPRVASGILSGPVRLEMRLQAVFETVVSRTRLEKLIQEFDLYPKERHASIMEDLAIRMRKQVELDVVAGDSFRVSFTGTNPITVLKVTERLTRLFIDESLTQRVRSVEGTTAFLEGRIAETGDRLAVLELEGERAGRTLSMPKRLELEVLQTTYKNLLTQREDARTVRSLERRQVGEQFNLLDAAQLPRQPIGPDHLRFTLSGGAIGLVFAALISLAISLRRMFGNRRGGMTPATSSEAGL